MSFGRAGPSSGVAINNSSALHYSTAADTSCCNTVDSARNKVKVPNTPVHHISNSQWKTKSRLQDPPPLVQSLSLNEPVPKDTIYSGVLDIHTSHHHLRGGNRDFPPSQGNSAQQRMSTKSKLTQALLKECPMLPPNFAHHHLPDASSEELKENAARLLQVHDDALKGHSDSHRRSLRSHQHRSPRQPEPTTTSLNSVAQTTIPAQQPQQALNPLPPPADTQAILSKATKVKPDFVTDLNRGVTERTRTGLVLRSKSRQEMWENEQRELEAKDKWLAKSFVSQLRGNASGLSNISSLQSSSRKATGVIKVGQRLRQPIVKYHRRTSPPRRGASTDSHFYPDEEVSPYQPLAAEVLDDVWHTSPEELKKFSIRKHNFHRYHKHQEAPVKGPPSISSSTSTTSPAEGNTRTNSVAPTRSSSPLFPHAQRPDVIDKEFEQTSRIKHVSQRGAERQQSNNNLDHLKDRLRAIEQQQQQQQLVSGHLSMSRQPCLDAQLLGPQVRRLKNEWAHLHISDDFLDDVEGYRESYARHVEYFGCTQPGLLASLSDDIVENVLKSVTEECAGFTDSVVDELFTEEFQPLDPAVLEELARNSQPSATVQPAPTNDVATYSTNSENQFPDLSKTLSTELKGALGLPSTVKTDPQTFPTTSPDPLPILNSQTLQITDTRPQNTVTQASRIEVPLPEVQVVMSANSAIPQISNHTDDIPFVARSPSPSPLPADVVQPVQVEAPVPMTVSEVVTNITSVEVDGIEAIDEAAIYSEDFDEDEVELSSVVEDVDSQADGDFTTVKSLSNELSSSTDAVITISKDFSSPYNPPPLPATPFPDFVLERPINAPTSSAVVQEPESYGHIRPFSVPLVVMDVESADVL